MDDDFAGVVIRDRFFSLSPESGQGNGHDQLREHLLGQQVAIVSPEVDQKTEN
jgi:hypothetical protein